MAKKKQTTRRQPVTIDERQPLSRSTFDLHWLEVSDSTITGRSFSQQQAIEREHFRATIEPLLAEALHEHHTSRRRVAQVLAELGHSEAARFFAEELPKSDRTRKGNFGEVVASEHLIQRYGYSMPVFKLRYRDSQLPMRGEDIVAFEMSEAGEIVRVIVGEAKAGNRFRRATVRDAHKRLKLAYQPRPKTLSMLSNILYERGEDELAAQIDKISIALASRAFPCANWIFVITETQPDDPFAVITEDGEPVEELCCVGITLPQLSVLVNALFDAGPVPSGEEE